MAKRFVAISAALLLCTGSFLPLSTGQAHSAASAPIPMAGAPQTDTQATFRLVNASPSGPALDVLVDGTSTTLTELAFTNASSYLAVAGSSLPGTQHTIEVVQTGTTAPVLASFSGRFVSQTDQTLVYLPGSTVLANYSDQLVDPIVAGMPGFVSVRFVNLALDNQAMDLWVDGSPVNAFTNIPFQGASNTALLDLFPHVLGLYQAGNLDNGGTALLPPLPETFMDERTYTVFVFGSSNSSPATLQLAVSTDAIFGYTYELPLIVR